MARSHAGDQPEKKLQARTKQAVASIFDQLDYQRLGPIYCDEGGEAFWKDRRKPCQILGLKLAEVLCGRLPPKGRSLYVGAGVAEIPVLAMEIIDLHRDVAAFNLRADEAALLNQACKNLDLQFTCNDAATAPGMFDHLWIVSTLNDPERFPELSALSYGRANPATFNAEAFERERRIVLSLADACLSKLTVPGLVTTSVEEIPWIADWCAKRGIACTVEDREYPTAIVGDPICLIRVGEDSR